VDRPAVSVEGAETGQIVDVGPVAGGQDDRVNRLGGAVCPDDTIWGEPVEHRPTGQPAGGERGGVAAVVEDHNRAGAVPAAGRQRFQAGPAGPVVHIEPEGTLRLEPDRVSAGDGHGGDLGEFDGDLYGGVPGADHHYSLPGELVRAAVVGGGQEGSGELGQTGKVGDMRSAEAAGCCDQTPRGQPARAG
jgi:hypothetical protein